MSRRSLLERAGATHTRLVCVCCNASGAERALLCQVCAKACAEGAVHCDALAAWSLRLDTELIANSAFVDSVQPSAHPLPAREHPHPYNSWRQATTLA